MSTFTLKVYKTFQLMYKLKQIISQNKIIHAF